MDQIEQLRSAATLLLEKAQSATVSELASAVEKATGVLRFSSELEKSQAEMRKLALEVRKLQYENDTAPKRERTERLKEYVSLLTPLVAIVTLAATLLFQGWQFRLSEKDKAEAAEEAQWQDAVKSISQTTKLSPGVVAINRFLKSPKYRDLAKDTAIQLLANSSDNAFFIDLFGAAFVPVGWDNLDYVVRLDRALTARGNPVWQRAWDEETQRSDLNKLSPQEKEVFGYLDYVLPQISSQVGSVLKAPRPSGPNLDLSATTFKVCDWQGADLSGANVEGLTLAWANLRDANLDNITHFQGVRFIQVAWWEAKKISPELLEYLANSASKYNPSAMYGVPGKTDTFTPQQYAAALDRLQHQSQ